MKNNGLSRSFTWLNVTQFLGALNDNVFKLLVVFYIVTLLGDEHRAAVLAAASTVFVLPFLLFSHASGVLADRFSKRNIIVIAKLLEALVMLFGCTAIYFKSPPALYAVIFFMCTQSALFGPSKYGIIPELVPAAALSKANSLLVGLSFLAIIIGTFIPSYLLLRVLNRNFLGLGVFCVAVAAAGIFASLRIEVTPAQGSRRRFSALFVKQIYGTLRDVRRDRHLSMAILGAAFFSFLGAFLQQNTMLYAQDNLGMDWIAGGYIFPVAALGIGLGALVSGRFSGRNIEFGIVPIGAAGLAAAAVMLGALQPDLWGAICIICLAGFSAGLFVVPLNAFIQYRSPPERRGEILAALNFISFLGIALAGGLVYVLYRLLRLPPSGGFIAIGGATAALAVVAIVVLPDFLVRLLVVMLTRCIYRIRMAGVDNLPVDGGALLTPNHFTWVDGLLLSAATQRRIRFVMAREIAAHPLLRALSRLMRVIPISPGDPPRKMVASIRAARQALADGFIVCIFPEGAVTRNGNMRKFRPGLEKIVRGTGCPIIPAYIGGAWGSIFSYQGGRLLGHVPKALPYPIQLVFGSPLPTTSTADDVERAVRELSATAFDLRKSRGRTLPRLFVRRARRRWFRRCVADSSGRKMTYGRTLVSALALSRRLAAAAGSEPYVGLLLPAGVGGVLANTALTLAGRIPVNLNFTASREAIDSAIRQCGIRTVISSRVFLEKTGFTLPDAEMLYMEDIVPSISRTCRTAAALKALFVPAGLLVRGKQGPDDPATVIFSSGSTGDPKGVVLTHHNIISNVESFAQVFNFRRNDRMCGVLPFFHSFGYTATLWTPLLIGFSVTYHPNPLDGARIAGLVRERRLTILLATPTFLLAYLRRAKREDFASLRVVVAGAEKLKPRLADSFEERFGVRPLEGYGATELAPVAAINVPDVTIDRVFQAGTREGSIGQPIPGVAMRVVDPDTGETLPSNTEGLLLVKGPNVMREYLSNPRKTAEVLKGGWYHTGDIARIDDDGFVFIVDRLSRYSKIGGEMVPHLAVEDVLSDGLHGVERALAVTAASDEKKGEQLVVFYTDDVGKPEKLHEIAQNSKLPNLWRPRRDNYFHIEELPKLGSGKLDLRRLRELAEQYTRDGVCET